MTLILNKYCEYLEEEHPPGSEAATSSAPGMTIKSLKPIHCLLNGCKGCKAFKQNLNVLPRDAKLRPEGPAAILRKALEPFQNSPAACLPLEPTNFDEMGIIPKALKLEELDVNLEHKNENKRKCIDVAAEDVLSKKYLATEPVEELMFNSTNNW